MSVNTVRPILRFLVNRTRTERDPALAQHVLHGLAEPQVDAQRQRTDEFRQANRFEGDCLAHSGFRAGPLGVPAPW
ncbi:MAG: hypothetical protein ACRD07_11945 [Acidimicrobiales bacterium]